MTSRFGCRMATAVGLMVALVGLTLTPAHAEMTPGETKLYEAAKANKESVTWYISHYASETAESLGKAFQAKYPGINANVVRTTAQVAFQRLSQDMKSRVQQCDVFSSTDLGHFSFLKGKNLLMKYTPESAAKAHKAFQGIDPDGYFHTTSAGLVLINYNTEKLKGKELPKKWADLLDPKWKGEVTVGHPGFSGYVGTWVVLMRKLYGWDYFKKLEANKPQIGRSINDTVTMLNAGERSIGAGPSATTLKSASKGNPVAVIYPEDGALLMIAPSGIIQGTKNPNAAKLFMEFLYSIEAAKVNVADFGESMRPEVPPQKGGKSVSEVKTVQPTFEEIEKGIPEVKELWRETFGI
ncbi:MAG: extracellular solute-binding protein [Hyphomicrobiaceae bacterium]|nr:extracellular solute-binding protein [Hyphomicrobiaceae bacterium]